MTARRRQGTRGLTRAKIREFEVSASEAVLADARTETLTRGRDDTVNYGKTTEQQPFGKSRIGRGREAGRHLPDCPS